jgi:hypothetical protein
MIWAAYNIVGHGLENDGVFGLADDHSGLSAVL